MKRRHVFVPDHLSGTRLAYFGGRWTRREVLGTDPQGREVVSFYQRYFAIARRGNSDGFEAVAVVRRVPGNIPPTFTTEGA